MYLFILTTPNIERPKTMITNLGKVQVTDRANTAIAIDKYMWQRSEEDTPQLVLEVIRRDMKVSINLEKDEKAGVVHVEAVLVDYDIPGDTGELRSKWDIDLACVNALFGSFDGYVDNAITKAMRGALWCMHEYTSKVNRMHNVINDLSHSYGEEIQRILREKFVSPKYCIVKPVDESDDEDQSDDKFLF